MRLGTGVGLGVGSNIISTNLFWVRPPTVLSELKNNQEEMNMFNIVRQMYTYLDELVNDKFAVPETCGKHATLEDVTE